MICFHFGIGRSFNKSIYVYISTVCPSGNDIKLCKYGKSSCHGNCFIEPEACSTVRALGVLSSAFSLNASARQGAGKRSRFKSIGVSPENQT